MVPAPGIPNQAIRGVAPPRCNATGIFCPTVRRERRRITEIRRRGHSGLDYHISRHGPELGETEPLVYVDYTNNNGTTFTDTEVEPSVLYVYRVKAAVNFFGDLGEAPSALTVKMSGSDGIVEPGSPAPAETKHAGGEPPRTRRFCRLASSRNHDEWQGNQDRLYGVGFLTGQGSRARRSQLNRSQG